MTSIIDARTTREMYGTAQITRTAVGKTIPFMSDHGPLLIPIALTAGKRCQIRTLNSSTKMMPTTNSGSEARANMTLEVTLSKVVSRLRALYPPNHSASGIAITD